ncbi:hypothetical protein F5887DRAFT_1079511 [Amanita rubescens]|nr:hypothetical protein F5887DRAFT_1079511 [Amanita rubescens]
MCERVGTPRMPTAVTDSGNGCARDKDYSVWSRDMDSPPQDVPRGDGDGVDARKLLVFFQSKTHSTPGLSQGFDPRAFDKEKMGSRAAHGSLPADGDAGDGSAGWEHGPGGVMVVQPPFCSPRDTKNSGKMHGYSRSMRGDSSQVSTPFAKGAYEKKGGKVQTFKKHGYEVQCECEEEGVNGDSVWSWWIEQAAGMLAETNRKARRLGAQIAGTGKR